MHEAAKLDSTAQIDPHVKNRKDPPPPPGARGFRGTLHRLLFPGPEGPSGDAETRVAARRALLTVAGGKEQLTRVRSTQSDPRTTGTSCVIQLRSPNGALRHVTHTHSNCWAEASRSQAVMQRSG